MKYSLGWTRPLPQPKPFYYTPPLGATLPETVDLSPEMPAVYDQGAIGSCTSMAGAALAQFLLKKLGNDFLPARLALYYWARQLDGTIRYDAGSSLTTMMKVLKKFGCPHEELWHYNTAKYKVKPPRKVLVDANKHRASQEMALHQDLTTFKSCLAEGYPFIFGFAVYSSFERIDNTGMMQIPQDGEELLGGHAVTAIGYDDFKSCFKIRNSWGSWGDKGHFLMPYDFIINNNYCDDFWTMRMIKTMI